MFANARGFSDGTDAVVTVSKTRAVPRDYSDNPHAFGRRPVTAWAVPEQGTEQDLVLAIAQHQTLLELYRHHDSTRARRVSQRFGFSVQRWSEYTLGKAWFTHAAWAAAVSELLRQRL